MKCDDLENKDYNNGMTAYELMEENGLVNTAKTVKDAIAELKDKIQMHDFFWEGCGFAKRGFKNAIAVSEAFDRIEAENAELKQKLEDVQASHYAEMVDAGMRERRLRRALWLTRALRARDIQRWWIAATCAPATERACNVWNNVERKCRAKAEEYK